MLPVLAVGVLNAEWPLATDNVAMFLKCYRRNLSSHPYRFEHDEKNFFSSTLPDVVKEDNSLALFYRNPAFTTCHDIVLRLGKIAKAQRKSRSTGRNK